jgi:hypothetical protein
VRNIEGANKEIATLVLLREIEALGRTYLIIAEMAMEAKKTFRINTARERES